MCLTLYCKNNQSFWSWSLLVGMTATALYRMFHKCVKWGERSRRVYEGEDQAERNAIQPHNCPHFTSKPQTWIFWLLCTHPLHTAHADWMCSGNGFLYQEEIKIKRAAPQADSSVQLRPSRGTRQLVGCRQGEWGGGVGWTFAQEGKAILFQ